ncbi:histidine phosphatase family protein [Catellatospora coxensis]
MTANRFLYLVRHGEADALGELTEAGLEQARLTGERLASVPFASVQHSPVRRAAHTAALITAHLPGVPVEESPLAGDYVPYLPPAAELPAPPGASSTATRLPRSPRARL